MRILVRCQENLYRLLNVESAERDGSLNISIHQRKKSHQVTLHQSGRVNFKNARETIYIEPLVRLTAPFVFYRYRVQRIPLLREFESTPTRDDAIVEAKQGADDVASFVLIISPRNSVKLAGSVEILYVDTYALTVVLEPAALAVQTPREANYLHMWPKEGRFIAQQLPEEAALVEFHQIQHKMFGSILYEPNGAGEWMLVFTVPMRVAPRVAIEMVNPELHVADHDLRRDDRSKRVMLCFKVRNKKTGQIIKVPTEIKSISLDSEL
jgi:hypothetical protein